MAATREHTSVRMHCRMYPSNSVEKMIAIVALPISSTKRFCVRITTSNLIGTTQSVSQGLVCGADLQQIPHARVVLQSGRHTCTQHPHVTHDRVVPCGGDSQIRLLTRKKAQHRRSNPSSILSEVAFSAFGEPAVDAPTGFEAPGAIGGSAGDSAE